MNDLAGQLGAKIGEVLNSPSGVAAVRDRSTPGAPQAEIMRAAGEKAIASYAEALASPAPAQKAGQSADAAKAALAFDGSAAGAAAMASFTAGIEQGGAAAVAAANRIAGQVRQALASGQAGAPGGKTSRSDGALHDGGPGSPTFGGPR